MNAVVTFIFRYGPEFPTSLVLIYQVVMSAMSTYTYSHLNELWDLR